MKFRRAALVALAVLALPLAASAQSRGAGSRSTASRSASGSGLSAAILLGMEDGDGDAGLALRADGVMPVQWLAPKVLLSGVLSVGFTHWGDSRSVPYARYEYSNNVFKLVPAARFAFDVAPKFGLYADAGIGLYYGSFNAKVTNYDYPYPGMITTSDANTSDVGLMMRFAGGATFDVSPTFRLGAEIGLNPYFGDYEDNTFSLMALAQFRL